MQPQNFNLRKELDKYIKYWPWFLLSLAIFISLGYFHLRYATPVYSAKASIIIKDDSSGGGADFFEDLGIAGMGTKNFDNEMGILRSRRLMKEVVKSLDLHIQYFIEGKVRAIELYEEVPFSMQVLKLDEEIIRKTGGITLLIKKTSDGYKITRPGTFTSFSAREGAPVNLGFANLVLTSEVDFSDEVTVRFSDVEKVAAGYRSRINLSQIAKSGGLIELEIRDPVKEKARDILDQLILEYNRDAIEGKNLIAGNTANFINERLDIINGELDSVETGKEMFKEQNLLTDIQTQSQMFVQNANEYNKRREEVGTQLELSNAMLEYITSSSSSDLLPSNLGIAENGVNEQIEEYNNLVLERNRILRGSSEKNPVIIRLNSNINQIKGNVVQSLNAMRRNLQIGQEDLQRQASSIGSQIYAVPSKERAYRGIERQQSIKETLYLFLLQKREENSLAMAVTEPKAKIVDNAFYQEWPISPNKRNIYLGTFILGLFLPISVIYMKGIFDDKIWSRGDVESYTHQIPMVGTIPRVKIRESIIGANDRSVLAESFRILVTNLQYLLVSSKNSRNGDVIFVTSTVKGEGKTFTAVNLAATLSHSGKKVLLIGMDLRNPSLQPFRSDDQLLGVSDYLINDTLSLHDLIGKAYFDPSLDIITSGSIPPNPYELLKQEKLHGLFHQLKELYDYIVVDTAPAMLVADTFLITSFADTVLYVLRSGFTEKDLLDFPITAKEEGKINDVSFILNSVKLTNLSYGAKYSYGYGEVKKGFWQRRTSSFRKSGQHPKILSRKVEYFGR